jgi:hypothetical protein
LLATVLLSHRPHPLAGDAIEALTFGHLQGER